MKVRVKAGLRVVGKPNPGEYNGNPTYRLFVMCQDGNGELKCTEDVYNKIGPVNDCIVPIYAEMLYNDVYRSMTITDFTFANATPSADNTASASGASATPNNTRTSGK